MRLIRALEVMLCTALVLFAGAGRAAPLALYDTAREPSPANAPLAPLGPPPAAPATGCGDFAVACSDAPAKAKPLTTLPFDYGLEVSGGVIASNHGSAAGGSISGWIKPKDVPLTVYFEYDRFQPIGGRR